MRNKPRAFIQPYPITYHPSADEPEADEPDSAYREAGFYYQRFRRGEDIELLRSEIGIDHKTLADWGRHKNSDESRLKNNALSFRCKVSEVFEKLVLSQADYRMAEASEEPKTLVEDGLLWDSRIRRKLRQIKAVDGFGRPVSVNRLAEILGLLMEKGETESHFKHRVLVAELQRERINTPPVPDPIVKRIEKLSPFLKKIDALEGLVAEASASPMIDIGRAQSISLKDTEALILSLPEIKEAPLIRKETKKGKQRKAALEKIFNRINKIESNLDERLLDFDVEITNCSCGRQAGHKGWCQPKVAQSPPRQELIQRWRTKRSPSQLDRYRQAQELGNLAEGESARFSMFPEEEPRQACNKLRCLLYVYKPTMMFRWSVVPVGREMLVMKIGRFN